MQQQRRQRFAAFAALAAAQPPTAQPPSSTAAVQPALTADEAGADAVLRLLARLWRLRWDNAHFEVYLRLALNGLPVAARMGNSGRPCPCGTPLPDRRHHFWECHVAQSLLQCLTHQVGTGTQLTPSNLWLGSPPEGVHAGVWDVVCLAAIVAMDSGRRRLAKHGPACGRDVRAKRRLVQNAARQATVRFWDLLQDFCALSMAPEAWRTVVVKGHPFMYWEPAESKWLLSFSF